MNCNYCGDELPNVRHHIFPELIICYESDYSLAQMYQRDLRNLSIKEHINKWKYLCPDINNDYNEEDIKKIFASNLRYLTEEYIVPSNTGNEEKKKYITLLYPKTLTIFNCVINKSWVGDRDLKAYSYTHAFQIMKDKYFIIDEGGYVRWK